MNFEPQWFMWRWAGSYELSSKNPKREMLR